MWSIIKDKYYKINPSGMYLNETFEKCSILFKTKEGEMLLESDEGQAPNFRMRFCWQKR
jgi:hypothetical protein